MDKKIEELEKKIKELEQKINLSNKMFGRAYSLIGSSDLDFLIKTRGQVKIQWGNKFIDLIKNGKINSESKFINTVKEVNNITKEGLYYVDSKQAVYLKINSLDPIYLPGKSDNFVSYNEQESTEEQKQQALINLGLIRETLDDISEIKNGFVYITSEDRVYIVKDGIAKDLLSYENNSNSNFLNPLLIQLTIDLKGERQGSLILNGTSKSNGLKFGSSWIYEDKGIVLENSYSVDFIISGIKVLSISSSGISIQNLIVNSINSTNSSFRISSDGIIECNKLIQNDSEEIKFDSDVSIYFYKAFINSDDYTPEYNDEGEIIETGSDIHNLTLNSNNFEEDDRVLVFTNSADDSENPIVYYGTIIKPIEDNTGDDDEGNNDGDDDNGDDDEDEETEIPIITVKFDNFVTENLTNCYIYVIERNNQKALVLKNNSLYLGYENPKLLIGYDNNGLIFNTIPSGIITMIRKNSDIPNGWSEYIDSEFNFTNLKLIIKN